jgi:hypothetical protein
VGGVMYVRKEELVELIKEHLGGEAAEKDSESIATYLLNIFGFHKGIADIMITSKDRVLFNHLYDLGILKIRNVSLGECRRINVMGHYYSIDEISYWFLEPEKNKETAQRNEDIYNSLPDEVWER